MAENCTMQNVNTRISGGRFEYFYEVFLAFFFFYRIIKKWKYEFLESVIRYGYTKFLTKNWDRSNFHDPRANHPMLRQVSQVDGNIQNNTSIKSQAAVPQAITVPQATRHQTPNTFINVFYKCLNFLQKHFTNT